MNLIELNKSLREKATAIKIDRARIKAMTRSLKCQIDKRNETINVLLKNEQFQLARAHNRSIIKAEAQIDSLNKLDYNLETEQKAYGKAIQKTNSLIGLRPAPAHWYEKEQVEKIKNELIKNILRVPFYKFRHWENCYAESW